MCAANEAEKWREEHESERPLDAATVVVVSAAVAVVQRPDACGDPGPARSAPLYNGGAHRLQSLAFDVLLPVHVRQREMHTNGQSTIICTVRKAFKLSVGNAELPRDAI